PQRRIVWGCEYPELLLTETAAWHDRRVKDTSDETPPDMDENDSGEAAKRAIQDDMTGMWIEGDASLDQYRIPQGSAFVELYCTRSYLEDSANNPSAVLNAFPKDLYRLAPGNNTAVLDLERMSALPGSGNVPYPVWRMAITEAHEMPQSPLGLSNIRLNDQAMLDSLSFRPEKMSMLHNQTADIDIERIVWFTRIAPAAGTYEANKVFWNRSTPAFLRPGNYAVVGPRPSTEISWGVGNTNGSIQQINLTGTTISHRLNTQAVNDAPAINLPALTIVAQTNPPSTWANAANPDRQIGFNISEPFPVNTGYYPEPNPTNLPRPNVPNDAYSSPHDIPFDEAMNADGDPVSDLFIDLARVRQGALPLETGLVQNFKTVFLQRLADPALGWNPEPPVGHPANQPHANGYQPNLPVNPYITVDWMPMDLTVFNGEDDDRAHPQEAKDANIVFDPQDQNPNATTRFRTRERSERSDRPSGDQNIWIQNSFVNTAPVNSTRNEDYFGFNLHHTFGALNSTYWPVPATPLPTPMEQFVSRGLTNVPMQPFPWIVWNNRPFVNQYELMQVPVSSPSRLLYEASTDNGASPYRFNRPARNPQNPPNQNALSYEQARAPFRHLLNFLHSDEDAGDAPNLIRLFEFVETPSPFAGTKEWLEPASFAWTTGTPPQVLAQADSLVAAGSLDLETRENLESLVAPMNHVYAFRNPGLVNVNTITDPRVLDAVAPGLPWADFVAGRQGTRNNLSTVPSAFSQPFRSTLASDLSPLPAGERAPTDTTLFRTDQGLQLANGGPPNGNLGGQQGKPQPSEDPLFDNNHNEVFRNSERHSYFKNQDLRRLGNLTTTHSNVYAVWITVGYFEVLPWNANDPLNTAAIPTPDLAHPDGYQLGRELGSETGQINRDRAFYIIDRSIPVGFEKGKNHNVDQTILLERFIED
ncbi:MAG: hypothetical protein KDA87_21620, partial [Planctomycetales bacterium]|nr:hypothetical protein [Planctomycetales bacterium]